MSSVKFFIKNNENQKTDLYAILKYMVENLQKSNITVEYSTALRTIAETLSANKETLNGKTGYFFDYDKFLSTLEKIKTDKQANELLDELVNSIDEVKLIESKKMKVYNKLNEVENEKI